MENRAVCYTDIRKAEVKDVMMPVLGNTEVLINVKATALCSQEQRMFNGVRKVCGYPCIAGHEAAGIVVEVGKDVKGIKVGDHVAFGAATERKFDGNPEAREDGIYTEEYASLSKYIKLRDELVVVIDDKNLPFEKACFCEPVSCVAMSVKRANIQFGDYVVVIGAGIMGLLHVQLAKKQGAIVMVSEIDPERCKKATGYGADYIINPKEVDLVAKVKELTNGNGADVVFNTTPIHESWSQALDMLAPYGKCLAYSSQHPDEPVGVKMGNLHSYNKQIIGTVDGWEQMKGAIRMIAHGVVDVETLTDSIYTFDECQKAFERATTPGVYRVVIIDK